MAKHHDEPKDEAAQSLARKRWNKPQEETRRNWPRTRGGTLGRTRRKEADQQQKTRKAKDENP